MQVTESFKKSFTIVTRLSLTLNFSQEKSLKSFLKERTLTLGSIDILFEFLFNFLWTFISVRKGKKVDILFLIFLVPMKNQDINKFTCTFLRFSLDLGLYITEDISKVFSTQGFFIKLCKIENYKGKIVQNAVFHIVNLQQVLEMFILIEIASNHFCST